MANGIGWRARNELKMLRISIGQIAFVADRTANLADRTARLKSAAVGGFGVICLVCSLESELGRKGNPPRIVPINR